MNDKDPPSYGESRINQDDQLYDHSGDDITLDEVERITIGN